MSREMKVYWMDAKLLEDRELYGRIWKILPSERKEKIDKIKPEQGKRLSAAAGFLLLYGIWERMFSERKREKNGEAEWEKEPLAPMKEITDWEYSVGAQGKPSIYIGGERFFYNLSHSKTKAACVIADGECGIDLEKIQPERVQDSLIKKVCTEAEATRLETLEKELRDRLFFKLWTCKESVMKWDGRGLLIAPGTIDVEEMIDRDEIHREGFHLYAYPQETYCLAVCCEKESKIQRVTVDKTAVEQFLCKIAGQEQ